MTGMHPRTSALHRSVRQLAACVLALPVLCAGSTARADARPLPPPLAAGSAAYESLPVCHAPEHMRVGCLAFELTPLPGSPAAAARPAHARARQAAPANAAAQLAPDTAEAEDFVGPAELHSAYGLPDDSPPADGTQTIALIDAYNDPHAEADLRAYDEAINENEALNDHGALKLPECTAANECFEQVNQNGETDNLPFPATMQALEDEEAVCKGTHRGNRAKACAEVQEADGWGVEISTDIEVAHAICENCHIRLVEADSPEYTDLEAAEETAERSVSADGLGATEISNSWGGEEPPVESPAFDNDYTHGIVITAAAGDDGYRNWTEAAEAQAHGETYYSGADYPASSPNVVAVGGTKLTLDQEGVRVGERVWNEDPDPSGENSGAGGGGCSAYFEAPPWQRAVPDWSQVGCGSKRAVADVAADGDPYTGVLVYDSTESTKYFLVIGGTSVASPIIAATYALAGGDDGAAHPAQTLYSHLSSGALHDVTEGGNGRCDDVYASCSGSMSSSSALYPFDCGSGVLICNAAAGYDGPSGVGTPNGIGAFQPGAESPRSEGERHAREAAEVKAQHEQAEKEARETQERDEREAREKAEAEARAEAEAKAKSAAEARKAEEERLIDEASKQGSTGSGGENSGENNSPTLPVQDNPLTTTTGSPSTTTNTPHGETPSGGTLTVRLSKLALTANASTALAHHRPMTAQVSFTFTLSAAARVRVTLERRDRRGWAPEPDAFTAAAAAGHDRLHLHGTLALAPGRYRLVLAPVHGAARSLTFTVAG